MAVRPKTVRARNLRRNATDAEQVLYYGITVTVTETILITVTVTTIVSVTVTVIVTVISAGFTVRLEPYFQPDGR